MNKLVVSAVVGTVLSIGVATRASATVYWGGKTGGNLNDVANWYDGDTKESRFPGAGEGKSDEAAYVTVSPTADLTLSDDFAIGSKYLYFGSERYQDVDVSLSLGNHALTVPYARCRLRYGARLTVKSGTLVNMPQHDEGAVSSLVLDGGTCMSTNNLTLTSKYPCVEIKNGGLLTCAPGFYICTDTTANPIVVGAGGTMKSADGQHLYLDGKVENLGGTIACTGDGRYTYVGYKQADAKLVVSNGVVSSTRIKIGNETDTQHPDAVNATLAITGSQSRIVGTDRIDLSPTATMTIDLDAKPEEALVKAGSFTFNAGSKIKITSSNKLADVLPFETAVLAATAQDIDWTKVTVEVAEDCDLKVVKKARQLVVRHGPKGLTVLVY